MGQNNLNYSRRPFKIFSISYFHVYFFNCKAKEASSDRFTISVIFIIFIIFICIITNQPTKHQSINQLVVRPRDPSDRPRQASPFVSVLGYVGLGCCPTAISNALFFTTCPLLPRFAHWSSTGYFVIFGHQSWNLIWAHSGSVVSLFQAELFDKVPNVYFPVTFLNSSQWRFRHSPI